MGEKGNLIIKRSELSLAADQNLEIEFEKTMKLMDEFSI
jgi:hypothetical protein